MFFEKKGVQNVQKKKNPPCGEKRAGGFVRSER